MAIYAIGDLQGCLKPLEKLLDTIHFSPNEDQIWFTGDLINRGPASLKTLRFVKSLGDAAVTVLGNHDLHFLAVATTRKPPKRKDTFADILSAPDRDELVQWLLQQPLLHYDAATGYVLSHAGIPPQWSLEQACELAAEVSNTLKGPNHLDFFHAMYGNEPTVWEDHLTGMDRLRVITNYLTRMRLLNSDYHLNLSYKKGLSNIPKPWQPWFHFPNLAAKKAQIIFGHWAALMGQCQHPRIHALDTGCVWGHCLTAIRLGDNQRFQCKC